MLKQVEVGFSVDFNEVVKGSHPETERPCYIALGTNHFTVQTEEGTVYTDGFSNPMAYIDCETDEIQIEGLTTFWHDEADEEEIHFDDVMQQQVVDQSEVYCEQLATDESIVNQLQRLIQYHTSK